MADVTIAQLTAGVPAGGNIVPFSTGSSTLGVPVSAMFQNAGNIGIGTSNPYAKLSIEGYGLLNGIQLGTRGDVNQATHSNINVANVEPRGALSIAVGKANVGYGDILLNKDATSNHGFVGIGTTTPSTKLDVNGTIKATALQVPGCVIQVVQSVKTNTQTMNLVSFEDVQGLSVNVTPKALNSRFFVQVQLSVSTINTQAPYIRITRNGVPIGGGDAAGSRTVCNAFMYAQVPAIMVTVPINYVDAPAYDALTPINYKVQLYANSGPGGGSVTVNAYVQGHGGDSDVASQPRASSSIIVQEIAG